MMMREIPDVIIIRKQHAGKAVSNAHLYKARQLVIVPDLTMSYGYQLHCSCTLVAIIIDGCTHGSIHVNVYKHEGGT